MDPNQLHQPQSNNVFYRDGDGKVHVSAKKVYTPHSNQVLIHKALKTYRNVVVDAGRRFGKSAFGLNEGLHWILTNKKKNQMVWLVLPTYKQAREIYWIDPDIVKYIMPYVDIGLIKKDDMHLSLFSYKTGSWFVLKGSDEPDSLRGSGLDLIIWDEVRDIKSSAFDIISPALADSPNYRQLFIGSPNGFDKFHDFLLMGDHAGTITRGGKNITARPEYFTFKFTSYDNTTWAEGSIERTSFVAYIDSERQKYHDLGMDDWADQEYMAEIRKKAGAVHMIFSRETHIIDDFVVPEDWKRLRGWDFGENHPTASLRIAEDEDGNWFIENCYKQRKEAISQHAEAIKEQDSDRKTVISGYGDPSGAQWIVELNRLGMNIIAAKKDSKTKQRSWIQLGIDMINAKLYPKFGHTVRLPDGRVIENAPSLFILNRPNNYKLVDEMESLVYKKTNEGILKTEIDDTQDTVGHYDLHAAFRYATVSAGYGVSFASVPTFRPPEKHPMPVSPAVPVRMEDEERKKLELQADLQIINMQNNLRKGSGWF